MQDNHKHRLTKQLIFIMLVYQLPYTRFLASNQYFEPKNWSARQQFLFLIGKGNEDSVLINSIIFKKANDRFKNQMSYHLNFSQYRFHIEGKEKFNIQCRFIYFQKETKKGIKKKTVFGASLSLILHVFILLKFEFFFLIVIIIIFKEVTPPFAKLQ